jgi:hypothetical protein
MNKYLTLLRGINVGGNNIIQMRELKNLFAEMGFTDVLTYIQSGNVIFKCREKNKTKLKTKIEKMLRKKCYLYFTANQPVGPKRFFKNSRDKNISKFNYQELELYGKII